MLIRSDQDSCSSLSIDRKSNEFNKNLRIYYADQSYIDIAIYQLSMNETFFIKDKKSFTLIKEAQTDTFFKFIGKFSDTDYFNFLQEKNYLDFSVDQDTSFPSELAIPSFDRESVQDSFTKMDISSVSALDNSVFNFGQPSGDVLINSDIPEKNNFSKKQDNLILDDEPEIISNQNFGKKEECNVTQGKKTDKKQERKKANRRKKKQDFEDELKKMAINKNIFHISKNIDVRECMESFQGVFNNDTQKIEHKNEEISYAENLNIFNIDFEKLDLNTDYHNQLLEMETHYKKEIVKINEIIEEKIEKLENGEILKDFKKEIVENSHIFYCQKNLRGPGKLLYKENKYNYCKIGNFYNKGLNGIGMQFPIGFFDQENITENDIFFYKVGLWENNDLVLGLRWELRLFENKSIFTLGRLKKDKKHGEALELITLHYDKTVLQKYYDMVLFNVINDIKISVINCGTYNEDFLNGKGKHIYCGISCINTQEFVQSLIGSFHTFGNEGFNGLQKHSDYFQSINQIDNYKYIYNGEFRNGKFDGIGLFTQEDGQTYYGSYKNGLKHGYGVHTQPEDQRYEGDFENDKPNGDGKIFYANGTVYEGEFVEGKFEGKGIKTEKDGEIYDGDWKNSIKNGHGVITKVNGDRWEGEFKNGTQNGFGIMNAVSGSYRGNFLKGVFHGKGRFTWPHGGFFEGDYVEGNRSGYGVLTSSNVKNMVVNNKSNEFPDFGKFMRTNFTFEGQFYENKPHGKGKFTESDGTFTEGIWVNGLQSGHGTKVMPNGNIFKGYWKDDKIYGEGEEQIIESMQKIRGFWENGKLIRYKIDEANQI